MAHMERIESTVIVPVALAERYTDPAEIMRALPTRESLAAMGGRGARLRIVIACVSVLAASFTAAAVHIATSPRPVAAPSASIATEAAVVDPPAPAAVPVLAPTATPDPPAFVEHPLPREVSYASLPRARHRTPRASAAPVVEAARDAAPPAGAPEPTEQIDPATGEVSPK
jgi:hypothetical protein